MEKTVNCALEKSNSGDLAKLRPVAAFFMADSEPFAGVFLPIAEFL